MPIYQQVSKDEKLDRALRKLQTTTQITSIGPGSIARSLSEILIDELDRFDGVLDFAISNTLVSKAQGRALDLIGELYDVQRKRLSDVAETSKIIGQFYFYINSPHNDDIVIPAGTTISTGGGTYADTYYFYSTTSNVTIPAGRLKTYAAITPNDNGSIYTAGPNTLTQHNFVGPVPVLSTNPKAIDAVEGYESDRPYRTRIVKAIRTVSGGTSEAIRFTALQVEGMRDAIVRNHPYGLGTIELIVVPEESGQLTRVLNEAKTEVEKVKPIGSRVLVRSPDFLTVEVDFQVTVKPEYRSDPLSGIARRAEIGVLRYLNSLLPGDKLRYALLVQSVLDSSEAVEDVIFRNIRVDGTEVLRQNFQPEKFEQIIPGSITGSAVISN